MRELESRLIQCLPKSSKGLNKDFMIVSEEWHDDIPCPKKEGRLGGALEKKKIILLFLFFTLLINFETII